jgi:hypothetical protein
MSPADISELVSVVWALPTMLARAKRRQRTKSVSDPRYNHQPVPLRIAFDLDGVFADMEGELARHAETLFGAGNHQVDSQQPDDRGPERVALPGSTAPGGPERAGLQESSDDEPALPRLRITARQQRRLWDHVEAIENFWETLREIEPGSVARLATIAAERRWEIIFLTRRPSSAGATSQVQSQRWLESKGFALPSVFVVQGSRGRIAASLALDIVIDDTPENCLDVVVDSKARAILVWREEKKQAPAAAKRLGIGVVKSVEECLDILSQIGAPGQKSGVMDRVKRLFSR